MQRKLLQFGRGFRVALSNKRLRAAQMVLGPGESEGGAGNRHRGADQWLYLLTGRGRLGQWQALPSRGRHPDAH
jgi:hypothetical protein